MIVESHRVVLLQLLLRSSQLAHLRVAAEAAIDV